jgi:hypothetical protein
MSDDIDPQLDAHLEAWRQSSRREPRRHAPERAREAMIAALASTATAPRTRSHHFRPRFRRAGLIAGAGVLAASVVVAAAGWNAAPGSPLFAVRAARQGVMLKLPGSDDVALHLQFAEQSLGEAQDRVDPEQSLANARTELAAALSVLPSERTSPLWARYYSDEQRLLAEESQLEIDGESQSAGAAPPTSTGNGSSDGPIPSATGGREDLNSPQSSSSALGGGDRSGGPISPSQSGGSPPPDN